MNKNNKTVFVGVSGGVDSSVSAALLKDQGYNVVGVFIRTWTPDFIECSWRNERRDAMKVCAHLNIPFLECNAEEEYKKNVALYMIEEYKKGHTPNPDVMCNREVKFGVFWNFAKSHGADFIATGHYAKVFFSPCEGGVSERRGGAPLRSKDHLPLAGEEKYFLKQSPDSSKDQSYFLWTLTQKDLEHILFPIGHLKKTEVRKLAKKYKLPTAVKKDSQGVCFLGPLDMKDFLKHYIESKKGNVLNENEEVIGTHDGAIFFTLGERHGFTITEKSSENRPLYVVSKNLKENTITVLNSPNNSFFSGPRTNSPDHSKKEFFSSLIINNTNWINELPDKNKIYTAQIRYHGELLNCHIKIISDKEARVTFDNDVLVDSGQSIVVYDKDICLGGGIVA
ncbi:MAG TPA: tRNA 2-thiouridine(34) synthase MnmA [Candidatus Paceibacterota bacterium]|nr:tRNA 2-thiouridine(34) synthase MnmA [Candidatus Paceibacterota bacterium]